MSRLTLCNAFGREYIKNIKEVFINNMKKRLFSLLLVLCMVLGMTAVTASAAEEMDDAVTVYFTVEGKTGGFATAGGQTMAMQKLTVPYFDLALYEMEDLYYSPDCYAGAGQVSQKAGTAETAKGNVTILHLFIYATEIFRCGLEPEDAGKGYLNEAGWPDFMVYNRYPGSAFVYFWDYSNDITYYLNYEYPLGEIGWGSTCDQIRIDDGDVITVRHDKGTEGFGTYHHFGPTGLVTKEISHGNDLSLTLYQTTKTADYSGTGHEPVGAGYTVSVASEPGGDALVQASTSSNGDVLLDTSALPAGRYYVTSDTYGPAVMLLLIDQHEYLSKITAPTCTKGGYTTYTCACGSTYTADKTAAAGHSFENDICTVCGQSANVALYGDANGDDEVDVTDVVLLAQYIAEGDVTINESAADVDGTQTVDVTDLVLLKQYIAEIITSFPVEDNN